MYFLEVIIRLVSHDKQMKEEKASEVVAEGHTPPLAKDDEEGEMSDVTSSSGDSSSSEEDDDDLPPLERARVRIQVLCGLIHSSEGCILLFIL